MANAKLASPLDRGAAHHARRQIIDLPVLPDRFGGAGLAALEKQQSSAATGDALGVFLIGVPTTSLTGGDKAGEIAVEKGKTPRRILRAG